MALLPSWPLFMALALPGLGAIETPAPAPAVSGRGVVIGGSGVNTNSTQANTSVSQNQVLSDWYADPDTAYYDGKYWVYPTTSLPFHQQTWMDAFSSSDLVHWEKHERVLTTDTVGWAERGLWAPSPVQGNNGWYYLYFTANVPDKTTSGIAGIGVAISTPGRPEGPYKDALGGPLVGEYHNNAQPIDPHVFVDDHGSGQAYLYFGNGRCNVAKLKSDMISFLPFDDGSIFKDITPKGYMEGPYMFKRKGIYYLMWSENAYWDNQYSVAYAMADNPLGPFNRTGTVLGEDPDIAVATGHHSLINLHNTDIWYIVYHRRPLSETDPNNRVIAIDLMHFNDDGTIDPVQISP